MKVMRSIVIISLFGLLLFACQSGEINEVRFLNHRLDFKLYPEKASASFKDEGIMTVKQGSNLLYLAPNAKIENFSLAGKQHPFMLLDSNKLKEINVDLQAKMAALDPPGEALWLLFDVTRSKNMDFSISYTAQFREDVSGVKFSNQNVGREVTGTILDKGAYLSPAAYYYPQGDDDLMNFEVTAAIPAQWESIADGNQVASVTMDAIKIQSWKNPFKSDGLMFMAAPFKVKQARAGEVNVFCYFFEEDTSLFETYLPATVDYINMYAELIGPYPYKRFTVAENFFPTGYGMPAWTLLGQQVIRLPFIVMTSLGHEVLHNYWGNSVYVDYENGNWCEGLTVYGADYHYKLQRGPGAAKEYRKDILKQYKSYVNAENEFPVREFQARHNAESRTIGYNKTMMIFHMIEENIGSEAFFQSWRDVYAGHRGEKVTWEQWIAAYEQAAGADLSKILPEWVDRKGAARLSVTLLDSEKKDGKTRAKFRVEQPGDHVYSLKIPIRFLGASDEDVEIRLNAKEAEFEFTLEGDFEAFELDPDYDLFRHLYPQEIEPILAGIMGTKDKQFVYYDEAAQGSLKAFGNALTETDVEPVSATQGVSAGLEGNYALVTLNPTKLPPSLADLVKIDKLTITVDGQMYPRKGHTFVLSAQEEEIAAKVLVLLSEDLESLPRIGELIPHYGKYSYLIFKGSKNVAKGQWPALTSPLRIKL